MGRAIVRLLRLASFLICATVVISFGIFAINETRSASSRQQAQLSAGTTTAGTTQATVESSPHKSTLHRVIDEASERVTSPFAGIVPGSGSEWLQRSVNLVLALALYGFALSFAARWFSVRV